MKTSQKIKVKRIINNAIADRVARDVIIETLNESGLRTGRGRLFDRKALTNFCSRNGIRIRYKEKTANIVGRTPTRETVVKTVTVDNVEQQLLQTARMLPAHLKYKLIRELLG